MAEKILGPFAVRFRDNYDPDATYRQLDLVYLDGSTWLHIAEGERSGVTPGTDPLVWFRSSTSASVEDRLAAAESAQAAAQHRQGAEDAKTAAETAQSSAEGARDAAAGAAGAAAGSASDAAGSATAAATSETNAAASATAAQEAAASVDGPGLLAAVRTHPHDGSVEGGVKIHYSNLDGRPALAADNLLINSDFRRPVNQRGVSGTISVAGYTIDMWRLHSGNMTIENGYIGVASGAVIEQRIENTLWAGEAVTISMIKHADQSLHTAQGIFPTVIGGEVTNIPLGDIGHVTLGRAAGYLYVRFLFSSAQSLSRAKGERGTVSTIMADGPKRYDVMLNDCERYLLWLPQYTALHGFFWAGGTARLHYDNDKLRTSPSPITMPDVQIYFNSTAPTYVPNGVYYTGKQLRFDLDGITNSINYSPILGRIQSTGGALFSAEL